MENKKVWTYIDLFLLLILSLVIIALFQLPDGRLHIIACDVGMGDAVLMVYKNIQIVTDGGPDGSVINCLGRHLPFWDRNIELVISTHPDADHATGLNEVTKRYKVKTILINPIDTGTPVYQLLKNGVGSKGITVINPISGLGLGMDLIRLDILSPTEDLLNRLTVQNDNTKLAKYIDVKDTNLFSIVYKLSFGEFRGLFLGDIPQEVSNQLSVNSNLEYVNYIKIPHHGSINGLTQNLLEKTALRGSVKSYGVISVGKKNLWNFPSEKILRMLKDYNVEVLRTDEVGDIEVVTDGNREWLRNN